MNKTEITTLRKNYIRTLDNCYYYLKSKKEKNFINEVGCLRGLYYSLSDNGINIPLQEDFKEMIKTVNKILEDEKI